MVSSLAAQLSQQTSLNAERLKSKSRHRHYGFSYLFTDQEAGQHDLDSIFSLAQNGYTALLALKPSIAQHGGDKLFSATSRSTDRTILPRDRVQELQAAIAGFLRSISEYILIPPADKVIEWLVRRFRVNEFDTQLVLEAFLPFHESTQFAKMLSILSIEPNSMWSFLIAYKKAAKPLARTDLIGAMTKDVDLARFISSVLPNSLEQQTAHTTLVNFNTSALVEYIARLKVLDEGIIGFLLPSLAQIIHPKAGGDCVLGGFVILTSLCQRCQLSKPALSTILTAMSRCGGVVSASNLLTALIAVSATQTELEQLPTELLSALGQTKLLAESIPPTLKWKGAEKFYVPLFASMDRQALYKWSPVVTSIANTSSISPSFIRRLTVILLGQFFSVLNEDITDDDDTIMFALSNLYQRHSDAFKAAASTLPDAMAPKVTRMITAFSLGISANDEVDSLLAARSEDALVRSSGLLQVLSAIPTYQADEEFMRSARDVISTNLAHSSDLSILTVLYGSPSTLLTIFPEKGVLLDTILRAIRTASDQSQSHSQSLPRSRIRLHLEFLAGPFCDAYPELKERIFEEAFIPFLLLTRPRAKLGRVVWEALLGAKQKETSVPGLFSHPLILGFKEELSPLFEDDETPNGGQLAAINFSVTNKIAQNILAANEYTKYLDFFLARINHQDSHTCIFALLVVRALLNILSTNHQQQLEVACKVLQHIGLDNLDALKDVLTDAETLAEFVAYESFGEIIASKPNSSTTRRRLHASIIALLPGISKPLNCPIQWLQADNQYTDPADTRGTRYVQLSRALYNLANSSACLHTLSTNLLRAMFINMKDEALLFLAGVWTSLSGSNDHTASNIQLSALAHAKAFLLAHQNKTEIPGVIDFQVIVPSLLVALNSPDRRVRTAALDNLKLVSEICGASDQRTIVYAADQIYGPKSAHVQILDLPDLGQYLTSIIERQGSLVVDLQYLRIVHEEILAKHSGSKKRERARKQRVLCYLLSHTVAWDNIHARLTLLRSLEGVRHSARLPLLLPLVQDIIQDHRAGNTEYFLPAEEMEEYYRLVFAVFDSTSLSLVNQEGSEALSAFEEAVRCSIDPAASPIMRRVPLLQLQKVFCTVLDTDRKLQLASSILDFAASSQGLIDSKIKEVLPDLTCDSDVAIQLLNNLSPGPFTSEQPSKRMRLDSVAESTDSAGDRISKLTILAEVLVSRPPHPTFEVISSILKALKKLLAHHGNNKVEYDYVEQLLLTVLEACISSVPEGKPASGVLGIDVLTDIIRATDNPQTFQQALLVISSVARLIPDSVLHHVLPIFTFMGSNVFHRDDSYSFRVVQKTMDSIVPLMAKSLRESHQNGLELYSASRSFLRIFTDASTHIPRHRRTQFFLHLVQVLGPSEFLAPVSMLLVDRNANRVSKQRDEEVVHTLSLPLSLLQHQDHATRLTVLVECLKECGRLMFKLNDPGEPDKPCFLELIPDDHNAPGANSVKKQVIALLAFVGHAVRLSAVKGQQLDQTTDDTNIQEVVSLLVAISSAKTSSSSIEYADITMAARRSLRKALAVIPATRFVSSIESLLMSEGSTVLEATLELFAERLPLMSQTTRESSQPSMLAILDRLQILLAKPTLSLYALKALYVVSDTQIAPETNSLSKVIPAIISIGLHGETALQVLKVLERLSSKLGPRLIPYIKSIVETASTGVKLTATAPPECATISMQIYQNLLASIPTFIGKELDVIITSCIGAAPGPDDGAEMPDVLATISERIPSRTLLPALSQLWVSVYHKTTAIGRLERFFKLVRHSVATAPRPEVMEHLKSLFKLFLEAFDLRGSLPKLDAQFVESSVISSFTELVTKLNEATFKPLFRRFFDWAFTTSDQNARKTTFGHVMASLFEMFKGILTPYMGTILSPISELFLKYENSRLRDPDLWSSALAMLRASFQHDEGVFWRDDRLEILLPRLVKQIPIMPVEDCSAFYSCLVSFSETVSGDELLKTLNSTLLMETRSEEPKVQLIALGAVSEIWKHGGGKFAPCISETITFVEDLAESENDQVAKESRRFKKVMETANGGQALAAMDL